MPLKIATSLPMLELHFSRLAETDLGGIADYTIAEFGIEQARIYRDQFQACFASLRDNPQLGRSAEEVSPGLRRVRQQAHVVFYRVVQAELHIVRVLHYSMDFERHF